MQGLCESRDVCHAIGHHGLPTQPLPRRAEDFPRGGYYPEDASLATSLINNFGLIFKYVKIMNVFTCGEEISKLAVSSSRTSCPFALWYLLLTWRLLNTIITKYHRSTGEFLIFRLCKLVLKYKKIFKLVARKFHCPEV